MWEQIPTPDVRTILADFDGLVDDDRLDEVGRHLWVPQGRPFHYRDRKRVVGQVSLLESDQSALRSTGRSGDPSSAAGADVSIGIVTSGRVRMERRGRPVDDVPASGVYVLRSWSSVDVELSDDTRGIIVRLPEQRLRERGVRVHPDKITLDPALSLAGPLATFVSTIVSPSWHPSVAAEQVVERAVEDLVVGMLLETSGYAMDSDDLRSGLRARAAALIAREHRDAALTPTAVAVALGVSLRHLQRAHEQAAMTVASVIAAERTRSAAALLVAPGATNLTLSEIAHRCGFSSTFELRNQFRAVHGMLPSTFRDEARRSPEPTG